VSEPDFDRIEAVVRQAAKAIRAAGVESVVIIITCDADNGETTRHYKHGLGNYYAQRGSVIEWIDMTREAPSRPEPPDEADFWKES
jgi:hypothetical protein